MSGGESTNSTSPTPIRAPHPKGSRPTSLLAPHFSQRFIDPLLPARPRLLEMIEDVAIDAQGNELLGAGKRSRLGQRLGPPWGRRLILRLVGLSRVACPKSPVASHLTTCLIAL